MPAAVRAAARGHEAVGRRASDMLLTITTTITWTSLRRARAAGPDATARLHPLERELIAAPRGDRSRERLSVGGTRSDRCTRLATQQGMLSFLVESADALRFHRRHAVRGSVGGVRAPGHTATSAEGFDHGPADGAPRHPRFSPATASRPPSSARIKHNPSIRVWRGLDREGTERCSVQAGRRRSSCSWRRL